MSKKKPVAVVGTSTTLGALLAEMQKNALSEQDRFAVMSDEEKAAYIEQREKENEEVEKYLKELRQYPGFAEIKV